MLALIAAAAVPSPDSALVLPLLLALAASRFRPQCRKFRSRWSSSSRRPRHRSRSRRRRNRSRRPSRTSKSPPMTRPRRPPRRRSTGTRPTRRPRPRRRPRPLPRQLRALRRKRIRLRPSRSRPRSRKDETAPPAHDLTPEPEGELPADKNPKPEDNPAQAAAPAAPPAPPKRPRSASRCRRSRSCRNTSSRARSKQSPVAGGNAESRYLTIVYGKIKAHLHESADAPPRSRQQARHRRFLCRRGRQSGRPQAGRVKRIAEPRHRRHGGDRRGCALPRAAELEPCLFELQLRPRPGAARRSLNAEVIHPDALEIE